MIENKCLCCGRSFQIKSDKCCEETCNQCHTNPTMNCPNA